MIPLSLVAIGLLQVMVTHSALPVASIVEETTPNSEVFVGATKPLVEKEIATVAASAPRRQHTGWAGG